MKTGILYVVATPIGNLKDITLRALEVLKEVDLILAEDTRVTQKLLNHYGVKKPIKSYHEHSPQSVCRFINEKLKEGENIAFVTDAGTPGISDPGCKLISYLRNQSILSEVEGLPFKITSIPGASAVTAALSVAGVNADRFTFLGYPPHKKGRQTFFKELREIKIKPIILYESPHRLQKTLLGLTDIFGAEKEIIIAKELTKIHEEFWHGTIENAQKYFTGPKAKGEFVLLIPQSPIVKMSKTPRSCPF